ncbi:MAG: AAA family ATPase [Polyangiaceae bacterium]
MASPMTIHRRWLEMLPKQGVFVTPAALVEAEAFPTSPVEDLAAALTRATGDGSAFTDPLSFVLDPHGLGWPKEMFVTPLLGSPLPPFVPVKVERHDGHEPPPPPLVLGALRMPDSKDGWTAVVTEDRGDIPDPVLRASEHAAFGRSVGAQIVISFWGREIRLLSCLFGSSAWLVFPLEALLPDSSGALDASPPPRRASSPDLNAIALGALHMLIGERRLLSLSEEKRLPALLTASRAVKLKALELRDFTVFRRGRLDLAEGINVIIGPNGSGKTHALKALYATARALASSDDESQRCAALVRKLTGVLRPDGDDAARLIRWGAAEAQVRVEVQRGKPAQLSFGRRDRSAPEVHATLDAGETAGDAPAPIGAWAGPERVVYIPPREVLSTFEGFGAAYTTRQIPFDETVYDVSEELGVPLLRATEEAFGAIQRRVEEILGGKVELRGNRFYLRRHKDDRLVEVHLLADGVRKLAALARLIANGAIQTNTLLVWDEPEANLNPIYVTKAADLLIDLVKQGVQVVVTSHDYLFVRHLSLMAEHKRHPDVPMRFFGFCPTEDQGVVIEQGDTLADLDHNPILDEFTRHVEAEQALVFGVD